MVQDQTRSATIYQFPVGGRDGQRALRAAQRPLLEGLPDGAALSAGESWYHAEAVREAERSRN